MSYQDIRVKLTNLSKEVIDQGKLILHYRILVKSIRDRMTLKRANHTKTSHLLFLTLIIQLIIFDLHYRNGDNLLSSMIRVFREGNL
jgi:hypothetical protein